MLYRTPRGRCRTALHPSIDPLNAGGATEAGVEPALLQKLPLRPGLGDAVLSQDHDAVRVPHGGEPVRGHQRGASHAEGVEGGRICASVPSSVTRPCPPPFLKTLTTDRKGLRRASDTRRYRPEAPHSPPRGSSSRPRGSGRGRSPCRSPRCNSPRRLRPRG